jgi:hypothetical protein
VQSGIEHFFYFVIVIANMYLFDAEAGISVYSRF